MFRGGGRAHPALQPTGSDATIRPVSITQHILPINHPHPAMRVLIQRGLGGKSIGSNFGRLLPGRVGGTRAEKYRGSAIAFSACPVFGTKRIFDRFFFSHPNPLFSAVAGTKNPFHQLRDSGLETIPAGLRSFSAPLNVVYRCSSWRPRSLFLLLARRTTARSGSLWATRVFQIPTLA